jgi:hypothetical protein
MFESKIRPATVDLINTNYAGDPLAYVSSADSALVTAFGQFPDDKDAIARTRDLLSDIFPGRAQTLHRSVAEQYLNLADHNIDLRQEPEVGYAAAMDFAVDLNSFTTTTGVYALKANIGAPITRALGLEGVSEFLIPGSTGMTLSEVGTIIETVKTHIKP